MVTHEAWDSIGLRFTRQPNQMCFIIISIMFIWMQHFFGPLKLFIHVVGLKILFSVCNAKRTKYTNITLIGWLQCKKMAPSANHCSITKGGNAGKAKVYVWLNAFILPSKLWKQLILFEIYLFFSTFGSRLFKYLLQKKKKCVRTSKITSSP